MEGTYQTCCLSPRRIPPLPPPLSPHAVSLHGTHDAKRRQPSLHLVPVGAAQRRRSRGQQLQERGGRCVREVPALPHVGALAGKAEMRVGKRGVGRCELHE